MTCHGGDAPPSQAAGYWVDVLVNQQRDYSVILCRDEMECIQGVLGSCAEGRQGRACSSCKDRHYPTWDGSCASCDSFYYWPYLVGLVLGGGLICTFFLVNFEPSVTQPASITAFATSSQIIQALQVLSAIRYLQIPWADPLRNILTVVGLFSFDLKVLYLQCAIADYTPLLELLIVLLVYPCFALILALVSVISKCLKYPTSYDTLFNINGMMLRVGFISITLAMLLPFKCQENPNGTMSMATEPQLVCFEVEHFSLMVMGGLGTLLYTVPILTWLIWITLQMRSQLSLTIGIRTLRRYRFFFGRLKPKSNHFGLVCVVRNLFVAVIPVALAHFPVMQTISMCAVLLGGLVFQAYCWPWRTHGANVADLLTQLFLSLVALSIMPLVRHNSSAESTSTYLTLVLMVCLFSCPVGLLCSQSCCSHTSQRVYDLFICHHKADAGNLARQIKTELGMRTHGSQIFLDSDQIEDLESQLDIVRVRTTHLLVLLSPRFLDSHHCAGELVVAHQNEVSIVTMMFDDHQAPERRKANHLATSWRSEDKCQLLALDISSKMIDDAYQHLIENMACEIDGTAAIVFTRLDNTRLRDQVWNELSNRCNLKSPVEAGLIRVQSSQTQATSAPEILITGAINDCEALSACEIMACMLRVGLSTDVQVAQNAAQTQLELPNVLAVVVLLTPGLLMDASFAMVVLEIMHRENDRIALVTVLASPSFQFPSQSYYEQLAATGLGLPGIGPVEAEMLLAAYESILSHTALPFSPCASKSVIEAELAELSILLKKMQNDKNGEPLVKPMASRVSRAFTVRQRPTYFIATSDSIRRDAKQTYESKTEAESLLDEQVEPAGADTQSENSQREDVAGIVAEQMQPSEPISLVDVRPQVAELMQSHEQVSSMDVQPQIVRPDHNLADSLQPPERSIGKAKKKRAWAKVTCDQNLADDLQPPETRIGKAQEKRFWAKLPSDADDLQSPGASTGNADRKPFWAKTTLNHDLADDLQRPEADTNAATERRVWAKCKRTKKPKKKQDKISAAPTMLL